MVPRVLSFRPWLALFDEDDVVDEEDGDDVERLDALTLAAAALTAASKAFVAKVLPSATAP